jgi:hypothetical protein
MERRENFMSNMKMMIFFILFISMNSFFIVGVFFVLKISPFSDTMRMISGFLIAGLFGVINIFYIVDKIQTNRANNLIRN